jgi:NADH-quinone oxidoreductase subunit M
MAYDFARWAQTWLWLAFFASFAVKLPMWPVHTWLPDAHVQAPTAGSVILAGRAAEDGRLRLHSLLAADVPRRIGPVHPAVFVLSGSRSSTPRLSPWFSAT